MSCHPLTSEKRKWTCLRVAVCRYVLVPSIKRPRVAGNKCQLGRTPIKSQRPLKSADSETMEQLVIQEQKKTIERLQTVLCQELKEKKRELNNRTKKNGTVKQALALLQSESTETVENIMTDLKGIDE
ncbi:unnamed protein product [Nezara viridula]|uniref:Uncharacterized protein n=1 Tax=Nezara viridula TaxID=85310 RepID=A0A9P0E2Y0_NEZVI|nr:unnamed protein product [Nezara viridula]